MSDVKRWLAFASCHDGVRLIPTEGHGPDFFVKANDYDVLAERIAALSAELAEVRCDRQREHELRVQYAGVIEAQAERIRKLEEARDLSAVASATMREESIAKSERIAGLESVLRKCRSAMTAGRSEADAARNSHYWEPVIKTIDAALAGMAKP